MQVEEELASYSPDRDTVLTVGVFDGVHLGHQRLIAELKEQAARLGCLAGVVTFKDHPEDLFSRGPRLPFLTDIEARAALLKEEGVDIIVPLSFDAETASVEASLFIELLRRYLKMRALVIGPDFALGKGREGTPEMLEGLGREMDFDVTVVPPLVIDGVVVSSTVLREALAHGDMEKVRRLSGRPFGLRGEVVHGAGRGEGLGFPTANIDISPGQALPPDGVYAGWAHINGKIYQSMTNIGRCPTFNGCDRTVESYLVNYDGSLYGTDMRLDIVARLRDEIKFDSVEDLKKQMAEDVRQGKVILASAGED